MRLWRGKLGIPFRQSIRSRLLMSMILVAVIPIAILTIVATENNRRSMEMEIIGTNLSNMKWTASYLDEQFADWNQLIYSMLINPYLDGYLRASEEADLSRKFAAQRDITDSLTNMYYSAGNQVLGVRLYAKDTRHLFVVNASTSSMRTPAVLPDIYSILLEQHKDVLIRTDPQDAGRFQLIRSINRFENKEKLGAISLDIRWDAVDKTLELLGRQNEMTVLITDADGHILYRSRGEASIPQGLANSLITEPEDGYRKEGENYVFYSAIESTGLRIVSLIPGSVINQSAWTTMRSGLLVGTLAAALAVVVAAFLAWRTATPIVTLARSLRDLDPIHGNTGPGSTRTDEIGMLERRLYQMSRRIKEQVRKEYVMRLEKNTAELKALQSQINPHFLQNTLQLIGSMLFAKQPQESYEIVRSLSDMFRYVIREPEDLTNLDAEIKHLGNYMKIQQQRFAHQLHYTVSIDEEELKAAIPKLSLQPLVENAFFHGLEPRQGTWELEIKAYKEESKLTIAIRDNGVGMSADRLNEVRMRLEQQDGQLWRQGSRIGLHNVAARIRLHFGEEYGISMESSAGQGTTVYLHIPAHQHLDSWSTRKGTSYG